MYKNKDEIEALDKQMKERGMIPLSEMLKSPPLIKYSLHKGVDNLERFEQWLDMRYGEMMRMKSIMILDNQEDCELYEWVLAHTAVLGEIRGQFKACKSK
jgi:hypothetical protein